MIARRVISVIVLVGAASVSFAYFTIGLLPINLFSLELPILARSIFLLLTELRRTRAALPICLLPRARVFDEAIRMVDGLTFFRAGALLVGPAGMIVGYRHAAA